MNANLINSKAFSLTEEDIYKSVQDIVIIASDHISVLGITLGDSLRFGMHISDMCKRHPDK